MDDGSPDGNGARTLIAKSKAAHLWVVLECFEANHAGKLEAHNGGIASLEEARRTAFPVGLSSLLIHVADHPLEIPARKQDDVGLPRSAPATRGCLPVACVLPSLSAAAHPACEPS